MPKKKKDIPRAQRPNLSEGIQYHIKKMNLREQKRKLKKIEKMEEKQAQADQDFILANVPQRARNVMKLSNVPHGFYENEMMKYYGQYGKILNLRVMRNKKTGACQGNAYVQFASIKPALRAINDSHGMLLNGKIVMAKLLEPNKVPKWLWRISEKRVKRLRLKDHKRKLAVDGHLERSEQPDPAPQNVQIQRLRSRDAKRARRLKEAGLFYEPLRVTEAPPKQAQKTVFESEEKLTTSSVPKSDEKKNTSKRKENAPAKTATATRVKK